MKFETSSINGMYKFIGETLLEQPEYVSHPRELRIHELINTTLILRNPRNRIITLPGRRFSKKYFVGELAFYLSGDNDLDFISHYAPFWRKVSDDGQTVNSNYGKRLFKDYNSSGYTQVEYAVNCLKKDKDSRKAVMMIYTPSDSKESKDNPCTLTLQAFIRNDELMLTTYMRSNDFWLGVPYDIAFFTILQEMMFVQLRRRYTDLRLGKYTHIVGSLHLYERNFRDVKLMLHDSIIQEESSILPEWTMYTYGQLEDFLDYEYEHREGRFPDRLWATDPFIHKLVEWLEVEA